MLNINRISSILLLSLFISILSGCGGATDVSAPRSIAGDSQAQLLSISITPSDPTIAVNTTEQLTATGIYSDNTTKDLTASVIWSAEDTNIAVVGSESIAYADGTTQGMMASTLYRAGSISGRSFGRTTVKVRYKDVSGHTTLTVTSVTLVSLAVTPVTDSIAKGTAQQFTAMGTFSDNTTQDLTTQVTWNSSDTGVATINASGLAVSVAAGSTTISAVSGGKTGSTTLTVNPATLVSLAITPTNPSIAIGTIQQFTAMGTYSDNTTQDLTASVTWTSSNTGVAAISNTAGSNGLAASTAAGSTTITAASGGVSGSTTLTVNPATLVSLSVTPANPSIGKGTTQQFTATGTFSDNTTQNLTTSVVWSSSNTGVAAISNATASKGLASATTAGSATITATSGGKSGSTSLTVTPAILTSIAVTPVNSSIGIGTTQQFMATGTYSDGTTQNLTTTATWGSSNTGVATISNASGSKGLASAAAAGSTTITATSGGKSGSTSLTVTSATLVSITVTPANPGIVKGTTQQFTATGTYSDNSTQNLTTTVTWSSSNTGVATISNATGSKGRATATAAGSTTITATSGSKSGSTTLTVTAATLTSITVTPVNPSIAAGTTQQFTATGTFSDGTSQNLTATATWSSSNTGVATISNATGSKGLTSATAAGTTTITAVSGSVSATATLSVSVVITGSATLSWNAPATNTDGTPLTDLAGYKIYYGTSSGNYTSVLDIGNVTTYTVNNLSAGVYYFAVTSYDTSGIESTYSNEASKIIQ